MLRAVGERTQGRLAICDFFITLANPPRHALHESCDQDDVPMRMRIMMSVYLTSIL
jgi:hypothetical protein